MDKRLPAKAQPTNPKGWLKPMAERLSDEELMAWREQATEAGRKFPSQGLLEALGSAADALGLVSRGTYKKEAIVPAIRELAARTETLEGLLRDCLSAFAWRSFPSGINELADRIDAALAHKD